MPGQSRLLDSRTRAIEYSLLCRCAARVHRPRIRALAVDEGLTFGDFFRSRHLERCHADLLERPEGTVLDVCMRGLQWHWYLCSRSLEGTLVRLSSDVLLPMTGHRG
jgi:hypothetical protein